MSNTLTTFYGKRIKIGQTYYGVRQNSDDVFTGVNTTTLTPSSELITRFATKEGAEKYIKRHSQGKRPALSKKIQPPTPVVRTPEELFEEEMRTLPIHEQLLHVTDRAGFNLWMTRNNLSFNNTLTNGAGNIEIRQRNVGPYISLTFSVTTTPHCCGGKEIGNHGGSVSQDLARNITEEIQFVLFKYLAEEFDILIKRDYANYGLVSYVVTANHFNQPSGRFGMMLNFSQHFQYITQFTNPNTSNVCQLYTVNDDWSNNTSSEELDEEDEEDHVFVNDDEDDDWDDDEDED